MFRTLLAVLVLASASATLAQPEVRVRGVGVDISNVGDGGQQLMFPKGTRTGWEKRYFKPGGEHLWGDRPEPLKGLDYATTPQAREDPRGVSLDAFAADGATRILIAVPVSDLDAEGWTRTDLSFDSSMDTFTVYAFDYEQAGEWVEIPSFDPDRPTILFGPPESLKFDNPVPISELANGVVIWESDDYFNRSNYVYDPHLVVAPNGHYVAGRKNHRYVSTDKGLTGRPSPTRTTASSTPRPSSSTTTSTSLATRMAEPRSGAPSTGPRTAVGPGRSR